MKVLVTGATGFVGSHLCDLLAQRNHSVYALARERQKFERWKVPGQLVLGCLESERPHPWVEALPADLDAVVHVAGVVHSFRAGVFEQVNVFATRRLIQDLKGHYPRLRFVLVSSQAAVGPSKEKLDEECVCRPVSAYGRSKQLAEECLAREAPDSWEKVVIRPPMVIGPRDPAMVDFFKMVGRGLVLVPGWEGLKKEYSFVGAYDLVDCLVKALETPAAKNQTFFVCYPEALTLAKLVAAAAVLMQKTPLVFPIPMPLLAGMAHLFKGLHRTFGFDPRLTPDKLHDLRPCAWCISSEKSERLLGMQYQWGLDRTVEVALEDYRRRGIL